MSLRYSILELRIYDYTNLPTNQEYGNSLKKCAPSPCMTLPDVPSFANQSSLFAFWCDEFRQEESTYIRCTMYWCNLFKKSQKDHVFDNVLYLRLAKLGTSSKARCVDWNYQQIYYKAPKEIREENHKNLNKLLSYNNKL